MLEQVARVSGQELKKLKNAEKVKRGPTDRPTDRPTQRGVESRSTRLKRLSQVGLRCFTLNTVYIIGYRFFRLSSDTILTRSFLYLEFVPRSGSRFFAVRNDFAVGALFLQSAAFESDLNHHVRRLLFCRNVTCVWMNFLWSIDGVNLPTCKSFFSPS